MRQAPIRGMVSLGLLALLWTGGAASSPGPSTRRARQVRTLHLENLEGRKPAGVGYSASAGLFYVTTVTAGNAKQAPGLSILAMTFDEEAAGEINLVSAPGDPINSTYDARFERLLWLDASGNRLLAIPRGEGGLPDTARATWLQIPAGLVLAPRGLATDPETGTLYILDSLARRLARIETDLSGRPRPGRVSFIPLSGVEGADLTGLAFEPGTGHLYLLNPTSRSLYEVTQIGRAVASYDVARSGLKKPAAMGFAPSGDRTDDPAALSLYVADQGGTGAQALGSVSEISLAEPEQVTSPAPLVSSSLVRTIATSSWSPPSPDPSGITYDSSRNRLLVTDGEVEEMSIWNNRNYFECSLTGSLLGGANLVSFSDEPVGVAFDPRNGHLFFSDDDARRVFEVDKGPDGTLRTSDDILTSFSTTAFGSGDPEGITVDYVGNRLFIADGVNAEIYVLRPGSNGRFEGGGDDVITHFDTAGLGVVDPETVEYNALRGTLYTIGHDGSRVVEMTTSGALVREIDTSYIDLDHPSGLAHAPGSTNSSARNLYISDRHADNDSSPNENDGRIYEITTGDSVGGNQAPIVSAGPDLTVALPASAGLNGTVSDDGLPTGTLTTTWTKVSGPGTVTFGNANAVDTTATLSAAGTYVLRLTANDGAATTSDTVQIIAIGTGGGSGGASEYRVSAGSDDAEEDALGGIDLVSSDIELVFDGTDQTVGLRFSGIAVPRGASITSAYLQFKVDEANIGPAPLLIRGQAADNAPTFTSAAGNISSRLKTTAAVSWSPPDWTTVGAAGTDQRSPDLSDVIEAITGRAGWSSGNALVLIITGTGERTAESFEGDAAGAAMLHIEVAGTGPGNQAPIVGAGPDLTITLPAVAGLNGSVTDDGLPSGTLTATWSKASGPGTVTFGNASSATTTAAFSTPGVYVLSLTGNDGVASSSDDVQITVNGSSVNIPPSVGAGPDQTITLPAGAGLNGTVADDGLPTGTLTTTWTKVSGPGSVSFGNASSVATSATFSAPGIYVLRLTANDGAAAASDDVQIIANQRPSVSAGPDQVIASPSTVGLDGTATDDGLPSGSLTTTWTKVSGPGNVVFGNAGSVDTSATFSAPGVYGLRLAADDGVSSTTDDVRIYVRDAVTGFIPVDVRVGIGSDDAEQRSKGQMVLTSTDLQIVVDGSNTQQVGIRFASVPILPGAIIRTATVQFKADEVDTGSTALLIRAQAADNASTFTSSRNNISSRTKTTASASWSPPGWTVEGAAGSAQRTPELAAVVQEVINRPGWSSGNALVLIITGSGRRTAESVEGDAAGAPLLHVEFQ